MTFMVPHGKKQAPIFIRERGINTTERGEGNLFWMYDSFESARDSTPLSTT